MTKKNKGALFLGCLFVVSSIVLSIIGHYQRKEMRKYGRIVLGYITKKSNSTNGADYRGYYYYDAKKYECRFSALGRGLLINDLVLVKVLSTHPETYKVLYDDEVPPCITLDKVPAEGWTVIPTCQ